jgi:hypothetical protein
LFREKWSPDDKDISSGSFVKDGEKWLEMVKKCNLGLWELNPRPCEKATMTPWFGKKKGGGQGLSP